MPNVEVSKVLDAPIDVVYEICRDFPSFPKFMPNVISVTVKEKGDNWTVTEWVTRLQGRTIRWVEKDVFNEAERHIRYDQVSGDLKTFAGEWFFVEEDGKTKVTMTCEFEFGIPVIAALLNPIAVIALRSNIEGMLAAISEESSRRVD